ncbi:CLUMA_CG011161, isoform A [Clunio marinus]|uniref:CLUMA_CG011161, isoform A n=1 Tax=Clunio marinus TaxID=568069 RepID=A0A1J1IFJ9_9DIPT|nr:CLUMA_CG011161, isoform A [Clunio marinus]
MAEVSNEVSPTYFVRGSRTRRSFRIRHRYNSKLPPSAILFMKTLEKYKVDESNSLRIRTKLCSNLKATQTMITEDSFSEDFYDPLAGDDEPLINKNPAANMKRRKCIKKDYSTKNSNKMSKIISFFLK